MSDGVRTFWLSFADPDRPKGQRFLGVSIVDVTPADADDANLELALRFPLAHDGADWIAAAIRKAHREHCNPGGEVMSIDITDAEPPAPLPKNRLLSFADLDALGLEPEIGDPDTLLSDQAARHVTKSAGDSERTH